MTPVAPFVSWCVEYMARLALNVHASRLHKPLALLPAQHGGLAFCIASVRMLGCSWSKAGLGLLQAVEEREAAQRREALSYDDAEVVVEVVREGELAGATAFVGARI